MDSGILLLTSTGFSSKAVRERFKALVFDYKKSSVAIVTTAAEEKENSTYAQLAKKQFSEMGFLHIDFVDFETESTKNFAKYDFIYVCGGNTFKLLKFARNANFKDSIKDLLKRNGIYIGVSAGSIIVGPSIEIAGEVASDKNEVGLQNLAGFGITNLIILPHYSPEIEKEVKTFETKHGILVERISNTQALLLQNRIKTIIE